GAMRVLDTDGVPTRVAWFTGDDQWVVASCGGDSSGDPMDIRVWSVARDGECFIAASGVRSIREVETSPRGRWLLISDDSGTRLFDLRSNARSPAQLDEPLTEATWHPDELWLVGLAADGR